MDSHSQAQLLRPELYAYDTVSSAPPKKRSGRTKFRETRHPVYKGVRRRGSNGERWVCEVRDPSNKSRIWLGTFPTAEMAARAYDVASMALRGHKACLNFADSAWRLVVPGSASHKDIQQAAAAAAEMFRPSAAAAFEIADEEQSSSSETLESSESDAERISSTTTTAVTVSSTSGIFFAEMYTTPSSESDVTADEEQSSSLESDAEKISSMTILPPPPTAVELSGLLDSTEFGGEYYLGEFWGVLTEPFALSAGYCWDDGSSDYVADVSLWSFST